MNQTPSASTTPLTVSITTTDVATPVGTLRVAVADDGRVVACGYLDHWGELQARTAHRFPQAEWTEGSSDAAAALQEYVAGDLTALDHLVVDTGGTTFQQRVWEALRSIPVGQTWSYRDLAEATGAGGGMRAVGQANGANPVSIVVPCHRVVRSDGTIGGYSGGLARKEWLLVHEGARLA